MDIRCTTVIPKSSTESNQVGSILPALAASLLLHIMIAGTASVLASRTAGPEPVDNSGTTLHLSLSHPRVPVAPPEESFPDPQPAPPIEQTETEQLETEQSQPEPAKSAAEKSLSTSSQRKVSKTARPEETPARQEPTEQLKPEETTPSASRLPEDGGAEASHSTPASADRADPVQAWLGELQERMNRNKIYPYQAIRRNLQGEVTLKIVIRPDGNLESADILSGHRAFHSPSLKALRNSLPLPPADSSRSITVTLSLKYEME